MGVSALNILVFSETGSHEINHNVISLIQWSTDIDAATATAAYKNQLIAISEGAANLGAIALLFLIGLESDLEELLGVGTQSAMVAVMGVVLPFSLGTFGLIYLFGSPLVPAIFAGAALTATSIGITAKVLQELNQLQSKEGQIIIGAAVIDDLLGILILAVVVSLVQIGRVNLNDLAYLLLSTTLFIGGIFLFRKQLGNAFVFLTSRMKTDSSLLVVAIVFALLWAGIANTIHLEAILGAFAAGIILAGTDKKHEIIEQFQPVANILSPIFFVVIGAKTDLTVLNPTTVTRVVEDVPILFASGGINKDFHVIYTHLKSQDLSKQDERVVVNHLLKEHPYALFIFSNNSRSHWHFLNVKYDDSPQKRRLFRRITVGEGEQLRTATERITLLDLESIKLDASPLEIQKQHDEAFDVEAVTDQFFKEYRKTFEKVEGLIKWSVDSERKRLFTQKLFNRLMFIRFIEKKGWLKFQKRTDYLSALWEYYKEQCRDVTYNVSTTTNFYRDRFVRSTSQRLGNTLNEVSSERFTISTAQPIKYPTQSISFPAYPPSAQIRCNLGNKYLSLFNTSFAPSRS